MFIWESERESDVLQEHKFKLFISEFWQREQENTSLENIKSHGRHFYGPFVRSCVKLEEKSLESRSLWRIAFDYSLRISRIIESKSYDNLHTIPCRHSAISPVSHPWSRNLFVICWRPLSFFSITFNDPEWFPPLVGNFKTQAEGKQEVVEAEFKTRATRFTFHNYWIYLWLKLKCFDTIVSQ